MRRPYVINLTSFSSKKKTGFIRIFFECEMLPVQKKAMCFRKVVDIYPETDRQALGLPDPNPSPLPRQQPQEQAA